MRVSEKNFTRKLADQAPLPTLRWDRGRFEEKPRLRWYVWSRRGCEEGPEQSHRTRVWTPALDAVAPLK